MSLPGDLSPAPAATFAGALLAPGPALPSGSNADLYDPLLGDWDAEVIDHLPGLPPRRQSAEMHFVRALEGRAIQDLWIAPARGERAGGVGPGNRFGTTLRVYDPALDAWRVTWWNPVTGTENRLVGRRAGSRIVQTGSDAEGRLVRWVFVEIGPDHFHWKGEISADGGQSWICETEFLARRRREGGRRTERP